MVFYFRSHLAPFLKSNIFCFLYFLTFFTLNFLHYSIVLESSELKLSIHVRNVLVKLFFLVAISV